MKVVAFEVVEYVGMKVVHRVEITGNKSESQIEKIERALVLKTDGDKYFVREVRR